MTHALQVADADRPLVQRAREGDFEAFEHLVARYERRLYTLAMRIVRNVQDAEEAVQETFLSVVEHLRDFREQSTFHTWLVQITTNHALKILRKRRGLKTVPIDNGDDQPLPHPQVIAPWREEPSAIAQRREARDLLDQAMEQLDEKYRFVFLLRDVEGLSTAQTAETLGITVTNTKVRLLRARLLLREHLTKAFGDEAKRLMPHAHDG